MSPQVPGTFKNGDHGGPNIPPDTKWDPENPPTFYRCSDEIFHKQGCTGDCGEFVATESQVEVVNENRRWARLNINPAVNVNGLDIMSRLDVIETHLMKLLDVDVEEYTDEIRWKRVEHMRTMRENVEPQIKRMQAQALTSGRVVGPHGEIIG